MPVGGRPCLSQPAQAAEPPVVASYVGGARPVRRLDAVLDQVAGLGLDDGLVHDVLLCSLMGAWSGWVVGSDFAQRDVAADGAGLEFDVLLTLLGGADALDVGAHGAGDGVDVGPDRGAGRDADAKVAAGAFDADPAAPDRADAQVSAAGGQGDVGVRGDDV